MKYFFLIKSGFYRRPVRTGLAMLSAVVAFTLFGLLQSVDSSIKHMVQIAHIDRLLTGDPATLPVPVAYREQIAKLPGIAKVTYANANVGTYRRPSERVFIYAIDPDAYFTIYPETIASASDRSAMARDRPGAIVARTAAKRYGWKRGDRIVIHLPAVLQRNGSMDWQFEIVGFCDYTNSPSAPVMLVNYAYIDAARLANRGTVQRFVSLLRDPSLAARVSQAIDALFANAPVSTRTETEKDFAQEQLGQLGDIDAFILAIMGAVFFALLLLLGNTLLQSFRERLHEFAVLKTIGFSDARVAALAIGEAVLFCWVAALAGLALSQIAIPLIASATGGLLPVQITPSVFLLGLLAATIVGFASGAIPAWRARSLTIVAALATH